MSSLAAAFLAGGAVVETIHEGGFWRLDAIVVAVLSLLVLAVQLVATPPDRRSLVVVCGIGATAAWWLYRADTTGSLSSFVPLGASLLAFAAAYVVVGSLSGRQRSQAGAAIPLLGALISGLGFVGLIWRWFPLAMPSQSTWRLASTITYSDAAGLLLAISLLVGLGVTLRPWLARATLFLCTAGLIATQSRGALIACLCGCAFVPARRYWHAIVPLACGFVVGVVAVASSPANHGLPWLAIALFAGLAVAIAAPTEGIVPTTRKQKLVVLAVLVGVACAAALAVQHEISLRALAPSDQDRSYEWRAAWQQFISSPLIGVGPDRLLTFSAPDGTFAHFAHNEFLQMLADGGVVGAGLLMFTGGAISRVMRRRDVLASCALAGFVCWVVAGAVDFDWHLPIVGLVGGWIVGLSTKGKE